MVSFLADQVTLLASCFTSRINSVGFFIKNSLAQIGRSGGTRTPSPRFWRPVLYQLSYTPPCQHCARHATSSQSLILVDLLDNFRNNASTNGASTQFHVSQTSILDPSRSAQSTPQTLLCIVTRHDHLCSSWQFHRPCYVSGSEIKLRPVISKKRGMATTFIFS